MKDILNSRRRCKNLLKNKLTTAQRIELSNDFIIPNNALKGVLKSDIENIRATMEKVNYEAFESTVNSILNSKKIYIVGLRSSAALADFLGFLFKFNIRQCKNRILRNE